jgi:hypothetical protein
MLLYRAIMPGRSKRRMITLEGVSLHKFYLPACFMILTL